jgi:transcriptional regulator with XRE-family HTH domain
VADFGRNLRDLRRARGMTQAQLAAAVGLSASSKGYISELELGRKMPTTTLLIRLARYFSVSVDALLGETTAPGDEQRAEDEGGR